MRLLGDLVDVHFFVEGKKVPAHKFIAGIHSPVLRMLTLGSTANPSKVFYVNFNYLKTY